MTVRDAILLVGVWVAWCALHSALIATRPRELARRRLGRMFRYYRLAYNAVAAVTLAPVVVYSRSLEGAELWRWDGLLAAVRVVLLLAAAGLFLAGARKYDMRRFLGLRQVRSGDAPGTLAAGGGLDTSGILGVTRHPWYLGAVLVVWLDHGVVTVPALIVDVVLTVYLVVGTVLEERKLEAEFGEEYRRYRRRVSMLWPLRWLRRRLGGAR